MTTYDIYLAQEIQKIYHKHVSSIIYPFLLPISFLLASQYCRKAIVYSCCLECVT